MRNTKITPPMAACYTKGRPNIFRTIARSIVPVLVCLCITRGFYLRILPSVALVFCALQLKRRAPEDEGARDALLSTFRHATKEENPLYSTTNNDIGFKRPTGATFTFERRARQQGFR